MKEKETNTNYSERAARNRMRIKVDMNTRMQQGVKLRGKLKEILGSTEITSLCLIPPQGEPEEEK